MLIASPGAASDEAPTEANLTEDDKFLNLSKTLNVASKVWVAYIHPVNLASTPLKWICVAGTYTYRLRYIANGFNRFYWSTNRSARLKKVVYSNLGLTSARPQSTPGTSVPPTTTSLRLNTLISGQYVELDDAIVMVGKLLVQEVRNDAPELHLYELDGNWQAPLADDLHWDHCQLAWTS